MKFDIIANGISPTDFAGFVTEKCTGLSTIYTSNYLTTAMQAGHPVLASLNQGFDKEDKETLVFHQVVITGFDDTTNLVKYYDPFYGDYFEKPFLDFSNMWETGGIKP